MFDIRSRISYIFGALWAALAVGFCGWVLGAGAAVMWFHQIPHSAAVALAAHACALAGAIISVWASIVGRPGRRPRAEG